MARNAKVPNDARFFSARTERPPPSSLRRQPQWGTLPTIQGCVRWAHSGPFNKIPVPSPIERRSLYFDSFVVALFIGKRDSVAFGSAGVSPASFGFYFGVILIATTGHTLSHAMQKMQASSFAGAAFLAEAG